MSRSAHCCITGLLLGTLLGGLWGRAADAGPISEEELLALVTTVNMGAVSAERVVELIQQRGISFPVKDILLQELKAREAHPAIIAAVKGGRQFEPAPPPGLKSAAPPPLKSPLPAVPEPPAPRPTAPAAAAAPSGVPDQESWSQFLEAVRSRALDYSDNLPNFICTQITQRFLRRLPKKGWVRVDNFVAELTYYDKQEHYKLLSVANRAAATDATLESLRGTTSTGEFGSSLNYLFDPETKTLFRLEGVDPSYSSPTVRVGFQVPKDTSKRTIIFRNGGAEQSVITPYRGRCWIDSVSLQVVKIEERAFRIPTTFPITRSEGSTEYDLVEIAGKEHWLPVRAEVLLEHRDARVHSKNVIEFKRYRKFGSDVKIVAD